MNNIQAKDLISLGLFTVLYFVLGCCVAIPIGFVPIFLPVLGALWAIITGIPFMLYVTRVKTFGLITLMAILSGLLMGLTGMGFWGVPMGAVFGLLGDLILKSGGYRSAVKILVGYAVFSLSSSVMRCSVFGWSAPTFRCISWWRRLTKVLRQATATSMRHRQWQ